MNYKYKLSYTIMDCETISYYTGLIENLKNFCRINLIKILGPGCNKVLNILLDKGCYSIQGAKFSLKKVS